MDTARKCRQELISKIKEHALDRIDKAQTIMDEVVPQFVEDPEAIWYIKYRSLEWLLIYPTASGTSSGDLCLAFVVAGCSKDGDEFNSSNTGLGLIFSIEQLYQGGFRHVPREELPTYLSWPYLSDKLNEILKG